MSQYNFFFFFLHFQTVHMSRSHTQCDLFEYLCVYLVSVYVVMLLFLRLNLHKTPGHFTPGFVCRSIVQFTCFTDILTCFKGEMVEQRRIVHFSRYFNTDLSDCFLYADLFYFPVMCFFLSLIYSYKSNCFLTQ